MPVAVERRQGERRVKVPRRRQIDPTTCERDYSGDEIEFMQALDAYKRANGRMFPTCSEVLEVIRNLGYVRVTADKRDTDLTLPPLPAAESIAADDDIDGASAQTTRLTTSSSRWQGNPTAATRSSFLLLLLFSWLPVLQLSPTALAPLPCPGYRSPAADALGSGVFVASGYPLPRHSADKDSRPPYVASSFGPWYG